MLIGNLGTEPELKYTENNTPICTFSMATNESWRAKDGKRHTTTEWHNITVWGKPGEAVSNYLSKGSPVHVEGRIQTNKYEKDGQKHYRTGIVASKVLFLGWVWSVTKEQDKRWSNKWESSSWRMLV